MKLVIKVLVLASITLLILTGCQPKLKPAELDILGTESCQPPCWRGIIPGKTTAEEVTKIFQDWETAGKGSWSRNTGTKDDMRWDYICWLGDIRPEVCLTINADVISNIRLSISSPSSLQLKDIINKYSYPDGYTLTLCVDCPDYMVSLYYPQKGLIFWIVSNWLIRFKNRGIGQLVLSPEMRVAHAVFTKQMEKEEMLKFYFGDNADIQLILKSYRSWNGYGEIPLSIP